MRVNYYQVSADAVSKKLRDVLSGVPELRVAVLFGSVLRRTSVRDLDVGVFLDPEPNFKGFIGIANMLEDALGMPVDVVPLKEAPPRLRLKALLKGMRLVVRDSKLYAFLLTEALSEATDVDLKFKETKGISKNYICL